MGGYDCTKSFSLIRVVEVNASAKIHQSDALLFICQQSSGSLSGSSVDMNRPDACLGFRGAYATPLWCDNR